MKCKQKWSQPSIAKGFFEQILDLDFKICIPRYPFIESSQQSPLEEYASDCLNSHLLEKQKKLPPSCSSSRSMSDLPVPAIPSSQKIRGELRSRLKLANPSRARDESPLGILPASEHRCWQHLSERGMAAELDDREAYKGVCGYFWTDWALWALATAFSAAEKLEAPDFLEVLETP
ncbi:hypothetical protein B0H14DRAFT_2605746 [Mycena olivaceomarginata]|nr:hypothetical protein B0H14DRAFT_2605746 [Mycena olivaceomarginata]